MFLLKGPLTKITRTHQCRLMCFGAFQIYAHETVAF